MSARRKAVVVSRLREYWIWQAMLARCNNPAHNSYKYYGARGIKVCAEWQHDFWAFYREIGPRPSSAHSVDRIDGSKGYEPGNVKWSTIGEQCNNRRSNRIVTFRGSTMTLMQAYRLSRSTVGYNIVHYRFHRGWPLEQALDLTN